MTRAGTAIAPREPSSFGSLPYSLTNAELIELAVAQTRDYALFVLDPKGYVATWNSGAERIKGYRADEIIGRHFSSFYTPEDIERGRPELGLRTAREHGRFYAEGWRVRKDGSRFWAGILITA